MFQFEIFDCYCRLFAEAGEDFIKSLYNALEKSKSHVAVKKGAAGELITLAEVGALLLCDNKTDSTSKRIYGSYNSRALTKRNYQAGHFR